MSKTINVGDVIFYKKIDSSYSLQEGDAIDNIDQFFVYPDDVVGLYIGKINRIGYPIVLINKFLSNFNGTRELYD